jgi:hypothetical protein
MTASIRTGAVALAIAVGLLAGAPASAQPQAQAQVQTQAQIQAPPSPEQVRLGVQFAGQMLDVIDLNALMAKQMATTFAGQDGEIFKIEPKWRDLFLEGMTEEFKADHAAIVTVLGRAFAKAFTADELKVGVTLFSDPVMPRVMKALMAGQPAPADAKPQTATLQAMGTPAGRSFLAKFSNLGPIMDQAKSDFVHVLVPGFFQRFGDKAMVLERQRRQAEGLPAAGG